MALICTTAPLTEPLTIEQAREQCGVIGTDHDARLTRLIKAARAACESRTGRSLITTEWRLELEAWPYRENRSGFDRTAILLPRPPVQSVESVKYINSSGTLTTLTANTDYIVQIADPETRIVPAPNTSWPSVGNYPAAVQVEFTSGYGDAPESVTGDRTAWDDLVAGMLMRLDHLFRNTADEITGGGVSKFDTASETMFATHAVGLIG